MNTIPVEDEPQLPGDPELERLATALVRWNAIAIVLQANAESSELGGHIASYQSAETLYEVGFNHFWRARSAGARRRPGLHAGALVAGHLRRAFLEGRLTEENLAASARRSTAAVSRSYPHPWLMPDFWQFPTVSMGLGPLMAIYQARFLKYMAARGVLEPGDRKVWAFMGDGEMDEPESMGAISLAGREQLDNLIFVINCNLQRLDGPVRGNGKIIQELETNFRGAGWNVIKVIWGSGWDPLLAADETGMLHYRMEECRRRRVPDVQIEATAPTCASTSSASTRRRARWSPTGPTTRSGRCGAAATTRRRSTPPTTQPSARPGSRRSSSPRRSRASAWARRARARTSRTSRRP